MSNLKRAAALLLVLLLSMSLLSACASGQTEGSAQVSILAEASAAAVESTTDEKSAPPEEQTPAVESAPAEESTPPEAEPPALDEQEVAAELYLPLGQTSAELSGGAGTGRFVSLRPEVVRVDEQSGVLEGLSPGMSVIELQQGDEVVSRARVYCFRPTTVTRSEKGNTRAEPSVLSTSCEASPEARERSWRLVCQQLQKDKPYGEYLTRHGCTVCAAAAVCRAWGAKDMTVDWLMRGGLERIAKENGRELEDEPLGYYGLQKVLAWGGISSKIYGSWSSVPAATEEMVRCLSEGRPVLLYLDNKAEWYGIGPLCVALHCVVVCGISEEGYVQIINSSQPHLVSGFKYQGELHQVELTPGELLEHFTRTSHPRRLVEDDFYFTKKGGLRTFLEITCDKSEERPEH